MKTLSTLFKSNVREYGMLIALIAIMIFFQYTTNGILFKPVNITNLVLQNSYIIIGVGNVVDHRLWLDRPVSGIGCRFCWRNCRGTMVKSVHWTRLFCFLILAILEPGTDIGLRTKIPLCCDLAGMLIFRGLTLAILQGSGRTFSVPF
jgi:putative multiple sugar transport system permease protein